MTRPGVVAAALTAMALSGIARTQPWLAQTAHAVRESDDVYAFPPHAQLHAATLGWDAAAADLIWAKLLVEYGTHWAEHRDFTVAPNYLDAVLELEPGFEPLYRYVDTILAYRPLVGTEADARKAREYLERGTRERPQDSLLWLRYGEFVAYLGPSFLHDEAEQAAWRRDGASAIGRAVELGADADHVLSAASLLSRSGQTDAAIRSLERSYAFTEHPSMTAVHEAIGRKLEALHASRAIETARTAERVIDEHWEQELPFLRRDTYLLLGPAVDAAHCSGVDASRDPACRREWDAP